MSSSGIPKYDYIIAGAGCAGLSLLYRILQQDFLQNKRILVLDSVKKHKNDRTWCFWEKHPGLFQPIVHHQWNELIFKSETVHNQFSLKDYSYKMIKGDDFYKYVLDYAKKFDNVTFKTEKVISFDPTNDAVQIETDINTYLGNYVFNSTPIYYPELSKATTLLQHFKGWVIKTETEVFNPKVGTLMDFTVSQEHGDTFMYVLPTSNKEALIEYTLFTEKTIDQKDYETALSNYIKDNLGIETYDLVHEEYGIIPMSTQSFNRVHSDSDRIIHLGTAGGSTKASSGYTFQFIQKHTSEIVDNLLADKSPLIPFSYRDKMFNWYDRTLLDIMIKKKLSGKYIFSLLFKKNNPETLLTFLGNESTFWQELKIMWSTPIFIFLPSGIRRLFK